MTALSQDEIAVLMIANGGNPIMPIGRWENPVKHLASLGYLQRADEMNHVITPSGKSALAADDAENTQQIANVVHGVTTQYASIQEAVQKCADTLAEAARRSHQITGDDEVAAVRKWSDVILNRALEILRSG